MLRTSPSDDFCSRIAALAAPSVIAEIAAPEPARLPWVAWNIAVLVSASVGLAVTIAHTVLFSKWATAVAILATVRPKTPSVSLTKACRLIDHP